MSGFNVNAAIAAAKAKGVDMTQAKSGGGDYTPPAAGFTRLRFVGYYEIGKHESTYQGQKKVNDMAELVFELSGPKHPPTVREDGTKIPHRVTEKVKISLNEKATFFKLFTAMNYDKSATHIAELLGKAFVAEVEHVVKKIDGKDVTFVNLRNIRKPTAVNPETGDEYTVNVDPPLTELKLFLWDFATPEMWDSIFIPGEYPEKKNDKGEVTAPAKSKNVIQQKIMSALNWKGSPVYAYATGSAEDKAVAAELDSVVGDVETVAANDADPLAGVA